jgi:hypothetical protein
MMWDNLAREGGNIRNAALNAAYIAATEWAATIMVVADRSM